MVQAVLENKSLVEERKKRQISDPLINISIDKGRRPQNIGTLWTHKTFRAEPFFRVSRSTSCQEGGGGGTSTKTDLYSPGPLIVPKTALYGTVAVSRLLPFSWLCTSQGLLSCRLVIPINLRASKALPKNCGRRPLVCRKTPEGEGRVFSWLFYA